MVFSNIYKSAVKYILYFLIVFVNVAPLYADDLMTIYHLAENNDTQYQAAIAEFNGVKESKVQRYSVLLPQLNITGYSSSLEQDIKGGITAGNNKYKNSGYNITLTQALLHEDKLIAIDQAEASIGEAEAELNNIKQILLLRVATQYFSVLSAEDNLMFVSAEKKAINEQRVQSKQRFEVGLTSITNVHESQARYDQTLASEIEAINTLEISKEILHEITNVEHKIFSTLKNDYPLVSPEPSNLGRWIRTSLTKNILLQKANKSVEVARHEVNRNNAAHRPNLNLVARYSDDNVGDGSVNPNRKKETSVMLQLNIPLYQGGIVNSRTRAAAYNLRRAQELREKQRRETIRKVRTTYLSVIAKISQAHALKQALISTGIGLEATQAGFDVGIRTGVDVLNSQRELYRASRDYAKSRYDYVLQMLQLKYAAGILSKNDLLQINNWLI